MNEHELSAAFAAAFSSGDVERVLALYHPRAVLVGATGKASVGIDAIDGALRPLVEAGLTMESRCRFAIATGDCALVSSAFSLIDRHGKVVHASTSSEVWRRNDAGPWRLLIDNLSGANG